MDNYISPNIIYWLVVCFVILLFWFIKKITKSKKKKIERTLFELDDKKLKEIEEEINKPRIFDFPGYEPYSAIDNKCPFCHEGIVFEVEPVVEMENKKLYECGKCEERGYL